MTETGPQPLCIPSITSTRCPRWARNWATSVGDGRFQPHRCVGIVEIIDDPARVSLSAGGGVLAGEKMDEHLQQELRLIVAPSGAEEGAQFRSFGPQGWGEGVKRSFPGRKFVP